MLTAQQQAALWFARKRHRIANSFEVAATPVLSATQNVAYDGFTVEASGGAQPYTYELAGGAFPDGIAIDAATGEVAGTPTETGAFIILLQAVDAYGTARRLPSFVLTVTA